MATKILSVFISLFIAGVLIFLVMFRFLPRNSVTMLAAVAIVYMVFRVVFNLPNNWIIYLGLFVGFLCIVTLVVYLLGLSGSSLVFQNPQKSFKPQYDDPVLTEMFEAFHKGRLGKWKTLLQSHPEHLHHTPFLNDILYDANEDEKSDARKLEALKYMLDSGAKIDSNQCNELAQFAYSGKADFVELLLQRGADPNCKIFSGSKTTLFYIIESYTNEGKIIQMLVKYGADINAKVYNEQFQETFTPLLFAAQLGHWRSARALLENGADPYYKNKEGVTIKDYILKLAENPEGHEYYKNPDLLELAEKIKGY